MKKCKIDPHGISLWGAAVKDVDGLTVFREGSLVKQTATDLI
jgi:hypothetical protein